MITKREILNKARNAVKAFAGVRRTTGTSLDYGHLDKWDWEFALLSEEEQNDWILKQFEKLEVI